MVSDINTYLASQLATLYISWPNIFMVPPLRTIKALTIDKQTDMPLLYTLSVTEILNKVDENRCRVCS